MAGSWRTAARHPLAIAAALVIAPGLALAYLGLQAISEREAGLRTSYSATTVLVHELMTGNQRELWTPPTGWHQRALSPDGQLLAFGYHELATADRPHFTRLATVAVESGEIRQLAELSGDDSLFPPTALTWTPDGGRLQIGRARFGGTAREDGPSGLSIGEAAICVPRTWTSRAHSARASTPTAVSWHLQRPIGNPRYGLSRTSCHGRSWGLRSEAGD